MSPHTKKDFHPRCWVQRLVEPLDVFVLSLKTLTEILKGRKEKCNTNKHDDVFTLKTPPASTEALR